MDEANLRTVILRDLVAELGLLRDKKAGSQIQDTLEQENPRDLGILRRCKVDGNPVDFKLHPMEFKEFNRVDVNVNVPKHPAGSVQERNECKKRPLNLKVPKAQQNAVLGDGGLCQLDAEIRSKDSKDKMKHEWMIQDPFIVRHAAKLESRQRWKGSMQRSCSTPRNSKETPRHSVATPSISPRRFRPRSPLTKPPMHGELQKSQSRVCSPIRHSRALLHAERHGRQKSQGEMKAPASKLQPRVSKRSCSPMRNQCSPNSDCAMKLTDAPDAAQVFYRLGHKQMTFGPLPDIQLSEKMATPYFGRVNFMQDI